MSVDIVCVLVVLYKCLDLMVFGYLMFNVCRSCFLWKLSMLFSSVVDIPHVPQLYNRIDLMRELYSLTLLTTFTFLRIHSESSFRRLVVASCFLRAMSSLSPNNEPSFLTCLHVSFSVAFFPECLWRVVFSVLSVLTSRLCCSSNLSACWLICCFTLVCCEEVAVVGIYHLVW